MKVQYETHVQPLRAPNQMEEMLTYRKAKREDFDDRTVHAQIYITQRLAENCEIRPIFTLNGISWRDREIASEFDSARFHR